MWVVLCVCWCVVVFECVFVCVGVGVCVVVCLGVVEDLSEI